MSQSAYSHSNGMWRMISSHNERDWNTKVYCVAWSWLHAPEEDGENVRHV